MTNELLPCRFCGNTDLLYDHKNLDDINDHILCKVCGHEASGFICDYTTIRSAKDLWNARNEKNNPFIEYHKKKEEILNSLRRIFY